MKVYLMKSGHAFEYKYPEEGFLFEAENKTGIFTLFKHKKKWYTTVCVDRNNGECIVEEIKIKKEPEETFKETYITCPYCGYENKDSFEASDSEDEYECGKCGSTFAYERIVDVSYSSSPVKLNENILEVST